jgi:molybdenum cofactor biosynthesis enzyme MoaA
VISARPVPGDDPPFIDERTATDRPLVALRGLDELWFQVTGTLCNLACTHCFIRCSPTNHTFGFLTLEQVETALAESVRWGVKEYYFTGGEPFLHRDLVAMLIRTLDYGPVSVLTNATVLQPQWLEALRHAAEASLYSLEFRVSIDGPTPAANDPVRGVGTFDRALRGVRLLVEQGFLPIITMTRLWDLADEPRVLREFQRVLAEQGVTRPRLKVLPKLQLGAEAERSHGYAPHDRVTASMLAGYDTSQLLCSHSRVMTDRGVYVCPILLDTSDAKLGDTLAEANTPFDLQHGACLTCYHYGAICTNPSSVARTV